MFWEKTPSEVPELLYISSGSLVNVEDSNTGEIKELGKEFDPSFQLEKALSDLGAEGLKEVGNQENSEEESDIDEEEEEEGEIEMATPGKKKARGRKRTE